MGQCVQPIQTMGHRYKVQNMIWRVHICEHTKLQPALILSKGNTHTTNTIFSQIYNTLYFKLIKNVLLVVVTLKNIDFQGSYGIFSKSKV